MKSRIIIIAFSVILTGLMAACGGSNSSNEGTHSHEDGAIHTDHATEQTAAPEQESFKADSTVVKSDSTNHDHDHDHNGSDHKH